VEAVLVILAFAALGDVLHGHEWTYRLEGHIVTAFRFDHAVIEHDHVIRHDVVNLLVPAEGILDQELVENMHVGALCLHQGQAFQRDFALGALRSGLHKVLRRKLRAVILGRMKITQPQQRRR